MPVDKQDTENQKIMAVINLINYVLRIYDTNIENNTKLAQKLEHFINLLESGQLPPRAIFTSYINQAMELTKSDPDADEGQIDTLLQWGQMIIKTLKLPVVDPKWLLTCTLQFLETLLASQRRHHHYRDLHMHDLTDKILSSYGVMDQVSVFPNKPGGGKKKETEKKRKFSFKK